eukprot:6173289-Pleurochrysis_carterae.AAC.2
MPSVSPISSAHLSFRPDLFALRSVRIAHSEQLSSPAPCLRAGVCRALTHRLDLMFAPAVQACARRSRPSRSTRSATATKSSSSPRSTRSGR